MTRFEPRNTTSQRNAVLVKTWDPLMRILHWWLAVTLLLQFGTGTIFWMWGDDLTNRMMFALNLPHFYCGYAFATALCIRVALLFVGPERYRWRDLVPLTEAQQRNWRRTVFYYASLGRRPCPRSLGHNAFAGPFYLMFFLIAAAQVAVGMYLSFLPGGSLQMDSGWMLLHRYLFLALASFVLAHIAAVVMREIHGKSNIASAMLHGYKEYSEEEYRDLVSQRE